MTSAPTQPAAAPSDEPAFGCPVRPEFDFFVGDRPAESGFREFDGFAAAGSPIFRADQGQGYYVVTEYEEILNGLQDPSVFSSSASIPTEPDPLFRMIPLHLDPPVHTYWRQVLGQYFSPGRVEGITDKIRARCRHLLDDLDGRGSADFVTDFARLYPTAIFLELLGLPGDELPRFMAWEHDILHGTTESDPGRVKAGQAAADVSAYLGELLAERIAAGSAGDGRDDLITAAAGWRINGAPPSTEDLLNCLLLLFMAGLDTVANQLSYAFHHLATHPADRQLLVEDPSKIPNAVEEMLRAFPIVVLSRKVTTDTEIAGCPIGQGEMVVFPLTAAGRDEGTFAHATDVDLERSDVRHLSFGAGPHRCLGSHLARRELVIALEEWHRRIPDYTLVDGAEVTEHSGGVYGIDTLALTWPVTSSR
jgi:cytochrome P450